MSGRKQTRKKRALRQRLLEQQDGACWYCGAGLTLDTSTLEHLVPRSRGGGVFDAPNLVAACGRCNRKKASHTLTDVAVSITGFGVMLVRPTFSRRVSSP